MPNEELKEAMSTNAKATHAIDPNDIVAAATEPGKDTHTAMAEARKDHDEKVAALTEKNKELSDDELAKKNNMALDEYLEIRNYALEELNTPVSDFGKSKEDYLFKRTSKEEREDERDNIKTRKTIGNWDSVTMESYHLHVEAQNKDNPNQQAYQQELDQTLEEFKYLDTSQVRNVQTSKQHIKKVNTDEISTEDLEKLKQDPNNIIIQTGNASDEKLKESNADAAFDFKTQEIYIKSLAENKKTEHTPHDPHKELEEGNHEFVHYDHWVNDGQGECYTTPNNAARSNRLTEKIAEAATWLQYAHLYTQYGDTKTVEINGEEKPLSDILERTPGLKETLEKLGEDFDINNPEHKKAIVQSASTYWDNARLDAYDHQAVSTAFFAKEYFATQSWDKQLDLLKNEEQTYNETTERMLKDVPILVGGIRVDLTDCRDLLDTMSTNEAKKLIADANFPAPSLEEMQEIDAHLTAKGLTQEEKMAYMKNFLANSYVRSGECEDPELRDIMLKHNPNITYADGIQVTQTQDGVAEVKIPSGMGEPIEVKMNASDLPTPEAPNKTLTASNENPNTTTKQTSEQEVPSNTVENATKEPDNKVLQQAIFAKMYNSR